MTNSNIASMEIGICWGTIGQASMLDFVEAAGRHGLTTLSVRPDYVLAAIEAVGEAGLRKRMSDAGVRVSVVDALVKGLPGAAALPPDDPAAGLFAVADEATVFRVAEAVGSPMIDLSHYKGDTTIPLSRWIDAIGGIAERGGARGISIGIEFVPDTGLPTIGFANEIVQAVGRPNLGVLLDPWHLSRSGGTVEDVRALPPGALNALQLCDRTPPPPGTPYVPMSGRDLPGEGQLPLYEIMTAALENRPGMSAEVEVFSAELRGLSADAAAARVAASVKAWKAGCW